MKVSSIFNIGYMPRWLIVCMDVVLAFFSILLSYLLRFNFDTERIDNDSFIQTISITVAVYFVSFLIFRSFKEIIRHTTFKGVLKIFLAVLSASIFLVFINLIFSDQFALVPYSVTGINFFISFFILGGSRIAIKKIFQTALQVKRNHIIIFGAGVMGQAALNTITADKFNNWRV